MTLSVVILSWNTLKLTRDCLQSVFANVKDLALTSEASKENVDFQYEVIVVDNGSNDGSAEMIEKEFPQVKLIKNNYNSGFTKGNNQGFRASRGEYILFLNSDTIVPPPTNLPGTDPGRLPGSVPEQMVEKMREDKSIGMLTPKLVYPDGRFQDEYYRKLPSITQTFWVYLFPFNKLTHSIRFLRKRYLSDVDPNKSGYINDYNVPGAAPLISRAAHEKVGGRDENIFYWMEDIDLFWAMQKAGYKMFYLAEAVIIHLGGMSNIMWDDLRKMLDFRRGYLYVFRKHKGKFEGFIVKWMFILNALISAPFLILCGFFGKKYWRKGVAALKFVWKFLPA